MTLYDYLSLMEDGYELTVWDEDYDIESYFYNVINVEDSWDKSMIELSKLLNVKEIRNNGVVVNLSKIIEDNLENLSKSNLFIECDIDLIMDDIENIISGYVDEKWMEIFVDALKNNYYFEAVEMCPHCMSESVHPMWDVNIRGYVVNCQHCGKEIFLCDECLHAEDNQNRKCDWCETECGGKCFRGIAKE